MGTAIRKHARDFAAIALLLVAGIFVAYVIVQEQRLRIPILEERDPQALLLHDHVGDEDSGDEQEGDRCEVACVLSDRSAHQRVP